jgi:LmbE family N-acetylglucosaminyl deacetylase
VAIRWLSKLNPYYHRRYIREILALRAKSGPYRFLVKDWARTKDFDLAAKILATGHFQGELDPVALPAEETGPLAVLAPHADDGLIGAGGTMLRAIAAGQDVHMIYVTDGAQTPPKPGPEVREAEARDFCDRLGATHHGIGISNVEPRPTREHLDRLARALEEIRPAVILSPWILDLPPKHRMVNDLLELALARTDLARAEVWGYQVHNALYPNGYVDITEEAEAKSALWAAYPSQLEIQRYDHITRGRDAWNSHILGSHASPRFVELFFAQPVPAFLDLFRRTCLRDPKAYYRGAESLRHAVGNLRDRIHGA